MRPAHSPHLRSRWPRGGVVTQRSAKPRTSPAISTTHCEKLASNWAIEISSLGMVSQQRTSTIPYQRRGMHAAQNRAPLQLFETVNPIAVTTTAASRASSSQSCAASPPRGQLINIPLWERWSARIRLLICAPPPGQSHRQHAFALSHQQTGRRDPGGVMPLCRQATLQAALTTFS